MSLQSPPREPARTPKGKGKGARRVSNLSEEQRNKKRENDRLAQQNIRRRNKELIESLQKEVEMLRKLKQVQANELLCDRIRDLERELEPYRRQRTSFLHNGRPYPTPAFDVDELPPGASHSGDYGGVSHAFGSSPYLSNAHPYEQWPSQVVPVAASVAVHSVESSPGASGPGEDFTPGYVHTSMPVLEGPVVTGASTPASGSAKPAKGRGPGDYGEVDLGSSAGNGYPNHKPPHPSSAYIQEAPWPVYSSGPYYGHASL